MPTLGTSNIVLNHDVSVLMLNAEQCQSTTHFGSSAVASTRNSDLCCQTLPQNRIKEPRSDSVRNNEYIAVKNEAETLR